MTWTRTTTALLVRVTDGVLLDLAGPQTLDRGRGYLRQVSGLREAAPGRIVADVHGRSGRYQVDLTLFDDRGEVELIGECTCPMGYDCKHVIAVLLVARGATAGEPSRLRAVAGQGDWERLLLPMVAATGPADGSYTPVALLLELQAAQPGRHGSGAAPVLAVRPMVPGKKGWVRTGLSWSNLDYPRGATRLDPRQAGALRRLLRTASDVHQYWTPDWLALSALDDGWPAALEACRTSGVELVTSQRGGGRVVLVAQPATVSFGLARQPAGDVLVTPTVTLPDELDSDRDLDWVGIGMPPTGLWARRGQDILLARFAAPVDLETARALAHGEITVPAADAARFLTQTAPLLAKRFTISSSSADLQVEVPSAPQLALSAVHRSGTRLDVEWTYAYQVGPSTLAVRIDSVEHQQMRDAEAERRLLAVAVTTGLPVRLLAETLPAQPARPLPWARLSGYDVVAFLDEVIPRLRQAGVQVDVTGEPVVYREAVEPPSVQLSVTDNAGEHDWFDLTVEVTVSGEQVPMADLVTAFTLGNTHIVLPTGTWFRVDRPELADLQRIVEEARALQDDSSGPLRLSPYHADLWAELEALGVVQQQSERWSRLVKHLSGEVTEPLDPPSGLLATLRPYQHDGYEWLTFLRRHGLGGILADDMGLGKTVQALATILRERSDVATEGDATEGDATEGDAAEGDAADGDARSSGDAGDALPWLVVAPTSVVGTWVSEAQRFAPGLRVAVRTETAARRGVPVADAAADADVVVTTYAVLRLDAEEFVAQRWAGLFLDEAQAVKNHQSVTYQTVRRLDAFARFVVTGTPMENNVMELWALLSIAAPGLFPSPRRFAEHYRRPIESGDAPERLDTLRRRIRPVLLRRTKDSVAKDLPAKQEQVIRVELEPAHRRIYDRGLTRQRQRVLGLLEDARRNRIAIFRALTVLRQLSLHPGLVEPADAGVPCAKLDTLLELLEPVLAEGHRALVFSQFTSFLTMVRQRFDAAGVSYSYLDGRTRNRERPIEEFRSGATQTFLISLKAGGVGLTLTEADYVFLLDPWWNPATEAQAVDRTHRIGQDKPVNVYRLVARETIEDKVVALQDRKRELFASVVDAGALTGPMTAEDIRALL